jgi:hypothetical protein
VIKADAQDNAVAKRLQTIPGVGPITASALAACVPDVSNFNAGRAGLVSGDPDVPRGGDLEALLLAGLQPFFVSA